MAEPQLISGRLLVTLDDGKENVGRIVQDKCIGEPRLMIRYVPLEVPLGEESPPTPERQRYDHIIFIKEMSDEVEIDGATYVGMTMDAILAVIPED